MTIEGLLRKISITEYPIIRFILKELEISQAVEKATSPEACFCAAGLMGQKPWFSFCILSSSLFCLGTDTNLSTTDNIQASVL